jgi:hypothetical protein
VISPLRDTKSRQFRLIDRSGLVLSRDGLQIGSDGVETLDLLQLAIRSRRHLFRSDTQDRRQ